MKKTVLFLMNGFGIEKKGSTPIYDAKLMPTMDKLSFEHIFASIPTTAYDYKEGFKLLSVGTEVSTVYHVVEEAFKNKELKKNEILNNHLNIQEPSKLHIMLSLENPQNVEQLNLFLSHFRKITQKPIWVHAIFFSETIHQYQYLDTYLSKLRSACETHKDVKIGIVMGKNYIYGNRNMEAVKKVYRMFINEVGEKWPKYTDKLETLYQSNINPKDAPPFIVNNGFKIEDNDAFFMMNYEVDTIEIMKSLFAPEQVSEYSDACKNIKIASLFPLKEPSIPSVLQYAESTVSLATTCEKLGVKTLVLTKRERMNEINYYLNGLKNALSPFIQFAVFDENHLHDEMTWNLIHSAIHMNDYQYIIIDCDIADYKTIDELKDALKGLDEILSKLHATCKNENMSLFITSLYGMKKTFTENDVSKLVNFSSKVPVIVADTAYPKNIYRFEYGNIYDLAITIEKNINPNREGKSLLKEKGKGFSLFGFLKKKK